MQKLTDAFNEASVKKGEVFAVELNNPYLGSGYSWDLQATAGRVSVLAENDIAPPRVPGSELSYGGGVKQTFILRAEEEGPLKIDAALRRPFEDKEVPPLRTQAFSLTVK